MKTKPTEAQQRSLETCVTYGSIGPLPQIKQSLRICVDVGWLEERDDKRFYITDLGRAVYKENKKEPRTVYARSEGFAPQQQTGGEDPWAIALNESGKRRWR